MRERIAVVIVLAMLGAHLLATSAFSDVDPVPGNPDYVPVIGEKGVLHIYQPWSKEVAPVIEVWTDFAALSKYTQAMANKAYQPEREKLFRDVKAYGELHVKAYGELLQKQHDTLTAGAKKRGEVIFLPDMTPVRVHALAKFVPGEVEDSNNLGPRKIRVDTLLVEVLDGPMKGRNFWATSITVRFPDSKPFDTTSSPKLLVESSSLNRRGNSVEVQFRVRNLTANILKSVWATVFFEDATGNLVDFGGTIVGDLKPGESKTVSMLDEHNPRMAHYKFEFEAKDDEGNLGGIEFTTQAAKPAGKTRQRR